MHQHPPQAPLEPNSSSRSVHKFRLIGLIERDGCSDIVTPSIPNAVKNCSIFISEDDRRYYIKQIPLTLEYIYTKWTVSNLLNLNYETSIGTVAGKILY